MKLSTKIILPIILISALLILLAGCFGIPDDSPGYTPGSITGRIMIPSQCADCLDDGPCLPSKSNGEIPSHWVAAEEAIVTVIPHATLTDEEGYYTLTNVEPGVFYVITATYKDLVLKDVVLPDGVEAGKAYDAGTANCYSTALGLYVEYLWDMEVDAGEIELLVETYIETDKFAELVNTVCCIIEDCDNITNYCCLVECDEPEFTCSSGSLSISIPTPDCCEEGIPCCTTITKPITVNYVGKSVDISDFNDSRLTWGTTPSGISFNKSSGEVCLTGDAGAYNISVTYNDNEPDLYCSVSKTISVTFSDCECPLPTVSAGADQIINTCPEIVPSEVSFSGSISGAYTSYAWNFDDGSVEVTNTLSPTHVFPAGDNAYNVTLSVNSTCGPASDSVSVTIAEYEGPEAIIGDPNPGEICPGESYVTVYFDGSSSTGDIVTYDWDFGDSTVVPDDGSTPSHDYTAAGTYTVTLTVTDANGCIDTAETSVEITQCVNTAPVLVQPPRQAISAGYVACVPTYKYTVVATDPDSDNLKFSLVANSYGNIPSGMAIGEDTGVITGWIPECCEGTRCHICCTECVKVRVVDDGCCETLSDEMEFCIEVWYGTIDGDGQTVGIGFDGCPIDEDFCQP